MSARTARHTNLSFVRKSKKTHANVSNNPFTHGEVFLCDFAGGATWMHKRHVDVGVAGVSLVLQSALCLTPIFDAHRQ